MSADTDNRDQPDVQHRATASDADTPGRPDAIESDRRAKMQAALRGAATRAGAIGRYLWAEFRATTMATASQTWRLVRYGIASARLSMSRRTLRRAHLAFGEKLYQDGSGDPAVRDAIRGLDDQIKAAKEAKRSASKLVAERRKQLIQLGECSASTGGASPTEPEHDRVLTCQENLDGDLHRLEATRIRLWPSNAEETKRVVVGAGVCLLMLIAVFMLPSGHNGDTGRSADGNAKGAGVPTATATSNPQTPTPAVAPFDEPQAKQHQQAWASHLDLPVEAVNSLGMKLVLIPPGEFLMGSPESGDVRFANESPQHRVQITKPFYLGVYEVTQAQYQKVMGSNPSGRKGESLPVETVLWDEAVAFCKRLSETPAEHAAGRTYSLPTEAEWEYACRAGSTSEYSFGDTEAELGKHSWYKENSGNSTHPVGKKLANAWGLYDMHGNVFEWCQDWRGDYQAGTATDPTGPGSASFRVGRGGCWYADAGYCRSACRHKLVPAFRLSSMGFRVAVVQSDTVGGSIPVVESMASDEVISWDTPEVSDKDTGKVHFVTTPKIPLQDKFHFAIVAGYITDTTAGPRERGRLIAAIYVYNLGEPGLLNKHMTLGLTFNELRLPFSNPRLIVEPTRAFDGVVETLEFGQLEPLLLVPGLENVRELRVDLDVISMRVPDQYVEMLRGLPVRLRDVARAHGFSPLGTAKAARKGQLKGLPRPAIAPFDAIGASQHQQAWASHLDVPVEMVNSIGMKLRLIPPGEFMMGSPDSDADAEEVEKPQHRVQITKPFYLGVYEVTQVEYQKVMGSNPSKFQGSRENFPVEMVSWDDATAFCKRLSEAVEEQSASRTYRLPTEAEWEYACRAGSTSKYSFGESEVELGKHAWCDRNSGHSTHPVGEKQANAWGLYDMHGNVSEWCLDWYGSYGATTASDPYGPGAGAASDPSAPDLAVLRVLRGGSWLLNGSFCRSADRCRLDRGRSNMSLGFRVAVVRSGR